MIICRTPFRISFFGGGTDYPVWYRRHGGSVLSTTIDKYCYITVRHLPPFFPHRIRVVYSKIELCNDCDAVAHPAVREALRFHGYRHGLEIHYDGDLPARSGMGSSSSFTVGLLHALHGLKGTLVSKQQLVTESIHVEQDRIGEIVGSQDQCAAAYGGFNRIDFGTDGGITVRPVILPGHRLGELGDHLMLFYTGIQRYSSDVARSYVSDMEKRFDYLTQMHAMVDQGVAILGDGGSLDRFGRLLHDAWMAKRALSDRISNDRIDHHYRTARRHGALGGKITGAGGGGFMLLFVPPDDQGRVEQALNELVRIPFTFDDTGSQIVFYAPQYEYDAASMMPAGIGHDGVGTVSYAA